MNNENLAVVGLPDDLKIQQDTNLCWAACLQSVLSHETILIPSQLELVRQVFGFEANEPATMQEVEAFLARLNEWGSAQPAPFQISYQRTTGLNANYLRNQLSKNNAVIANLRNPSSNVGHAVVVIAAGFATGAGGRIVTRLTYYDPADNTLHDMTLDQIARVEALWAVDVLPLTQDEDDEIQQIADSL